MEKDANELFDAYRELYYEGGTSSVYLWDLDTGFAGCFLIRKRVAADRFVKEGGWDAIHVVEVQDNTASHAKSVYKLTTTVIVSMNVERPEVGVASLSGSLTRQKESSVMATDASPHIANIGHMIEDMEGEIRSNMNELYILKTREVVNNLHHPNAGGRPVQGEEHTSFLRDAITRRGMGKKVDSEA